MHLEKRKNKYRMQSTCNHVLSKFVNEPFVGLNLARPFAENDPGT